MIGLNTRWLVVKERISIPSFLVSTGERIRYVVAYGVLQLPTGELDIMASIEDNYQKVARTNNCSSQSNNRRHQPATLPWQVHEVWSY